MNFDFGKLVLDANPDRGRREHDQRAGVEVNRLLLSRCVGALLVLLGGTVMLGWWLQSDTLLRVLPDPTSMVFNTALCFTLAGGALLLPPAPIWSARGMTACGGLVAAVAALVLAEHLLQADLGIDWAALHAWRKDANPKPGRIAAAAATAFLLSGVVLILMARVRRPWLAGVVRALTLGIGTIGALGLAAYFVSAQLLFAQYRFVGIAPSVAAGLLLLAFGLRSFWQRFDWGRAPLFVREDDRITFASATVLGAVALGAVIATFAILQGTVQTLVRDHVHAALKNRGEVFQDLIRLREAGAQSAALRPAAARNLRVIRAGGDDGSNLANINAVVDSFLKLGFSAIAYHDLDGRVVASGGRFARTPAISVALATPAGAELLWDAGLVLRHRFAMHDPLGTVGEVLTEQPLSVLTRILLDPAGSGATWDMGLCVSRDQQLLCFPQRLNAQVFSAPLVNVAGEPLPMTRALRGETGTTVTRDYRAQNVLAAYGPVGDLGLGMVVKVDTAEVFGPIREQLQLALGLLLAVVAGGALLVRFRIRPLATRLQGALDERAAGLHRAQQVAKLAHVITRPDGSFDTWSETLPQLIGVEPAEMPRSTRNWLDIVHPEDRALFRGKAIEAGAKGVRTEVEYRLRRSDGAWIHVQQTMEPLGGESRTDGRIRWFNTLQDVTAQKRAEQELRESESLKAVILESSLDALITIDHQGRILEFNPAAEAMFGISRERALGQSMAELIVPPRLREAHRRGFAHYLATGEGPVLGKRLELEALRADGTEFPIELAITPITSRSTPLFTGFIRDITQRRESETKINRLNAELEQRVEQRTAELKAANHELEAFSYSVSHDLRAPLRHIDGFADMLREQCAPALDASGQRYLGVITESVKQMGQLIDDLLLFSKTGRVEMHQTQVSMDELVKEVVKTLAGECRNRSIEWEIETLPDVRGDRSMLRQVWVNLLSNSVKYTRDRPLAKIRIGYSKATDEFHVQDNGAGFEMTYAHKLFGVFQRLHRADEFEGTGVGLANVQRIITRHGGRIRAQGKVNEGATFHFSLPVHQGDDPCHH